MTRGRKVNFTSSGYVTGNLCTSMIDVFVKGVEALGVSYVEYAAGLEDETLGLTERAGKKVLHRVREVINNIEHGRGSKKHGTINLNKRHGQRQVLEQFVKALKSESEKRERDARNQAIDKKVEAALPEDIKSKFNLPRKFDEMLEQPAKELQMSIDMSANISKDEMKDMLTGGVGESTEQIDCTLYALLKDAQLKDILEFARVGLEGTNTEKLKDELRAAQEKLRFTEKELKETTASLDHQRKKVEEKNETIKELRQQLQGAKAKAKAALKEALSSL